ncbi:hypothetical protein [Arthrobacter antioxidans]|uniref:hypothetical protein n=1 Tax=Arthrobacter antioxidans TaxID=2895818 RepID=UPI001FFEAE2E|nr:hypothetical protein [Arthrobacter antioxidans]
MNTTPRGLNRMVLAVVGLLAFAAGAAGLALLTVPAVASWWRSSAPRVGEAVDGARTRTTLDGQEDTWLWLALAAVLLLLIVLLVLWIAAQGRGRTGTFASTEDARGPEVGRGAGTPGTVTITAAAAEQALKAALLERPDLAATSVSTWVVRGVPGLHVRVFPRKGVPAYAVAADISRLVEALDRVTGYRTPVLISIRSGARVRFSRADRVA